MRMMVTTLTCWMETDLRASTRSLQQGEHKHGSCSAVSYKLASGSWCNTDRRGKYQLDWLVTASE